MIRIFFLLLPLFLSAREFNLLVIHSYSDQYEWTQGQTQGFLEELATSTGHKFNIKTEYLDTKRVDICDEYISRYGEFLAFKYADFLPDAIYVTDDNALRFVQKLKSRRYTRVPVFFSGINQTDLKLDKSTYAGVFERKEFVKNIALIRRLFPKAGKLLVIGDNSSTYAIIKEQIERTPERDLLSFSLGFAESSSINELMREITRHDDFILLLTTVGKIKNDKNEELSLGEIIPLLASRTKQPLFSMEDVYMRPEVFGGYTTNSLLQGKLAGRMVLDFAGGQAMQDIPDRLEEASSYLFSEPQLERFDIVLAPEVEKEATVLFKKPSFFQENEHFIYTVIVVLVTLILAGLLLFSLFILRKNRVISTFSKAVERSEKRFREMFNQHAAVMLFIDPKTSAIINANKAAEVFYGYTTGQLQHMKITELNTLSPETVQEHQSSAEANRQNYFVFRHRLANSEERDVEVYSTPILTDEGRLLFSIIHDITEVVAYRTHLEERVRSEIEKRQSNEQLMVQQSKHAAMGEMINAIAHQWRQPLNALGIFIQDLEDAYDFNELDKEYIEKLVQHSMSQINFMSKTIDDFRDFFRPDKHKTHFQAQAVIEEVVSLLRAQLRAHSINLVIEGEDFTLYNYTNEFKQVILNIINNAKDAIIDAKISNSARSGGNFWIRISLSLPGGEPTIQIEDNAGGIKEAILPRIFEPYFTTKEQGKGTGIGLYLVKTIIEDHMHGTIRAQNSQEGARFVITLQKDTE